MEVNQIYEIVNSVTSQAMGQSALTVVDEQGLISLGNEVLSSATNTELFMNTLVQRIGRTIFSFREYRSKFKGLLLEDFEWGAIVQKIKVKMPSAEADEQYDLQDGGSVDMYKIAKPKATQKLFITETPYQFHITIQRTLLKEAFLSEGAMGSFIGAIFGEVQNKIEMALENLGRNAVVNYIAEVSDKPTRAINLLARYNADTGNALTVAQALNDADFLRYATGIINAYRTRLTDMSTLYNDGTETRHTPKELQRLYLSLDFNTKLATIVQYGAFNEERVSLYDFEELSFWQNAQTPNQIDVMRASDGKEIKLDNIIGVLADRDAFGIYKHEEWTSTTPFNSAGGYANTYWHMKELYFNDLSENFILFYLGDSSAN